MVILIGGASHTGKTCLSQKLLERYGFPCLSIDHLKMGLIRSGQTSLTPEDDGELTGYLWPIVREMIKTVIENRQNLIVEGCTIPFDWRDSFGEAYLSQIRYVCLVMSEGYIRTHMEEIRTHAHDVERRMDDEVHLSELVEENARNREQCLLHGCEMIEIDGEYQAEFSL